jgi:site-specific DNA recombinase
MMKMRAVIYARYSSENQRDASIEDQVRVCRMYIEREGWTYLHAYSDRAISGSTPFRPGYQKLLQDARCGQFEIVVAEALDRLSRDQEDTAAIFKRLTYAGIRIITLSEGPISELHVGLKGTMNALFLRDLADKIRRGQRGRIHAGRASGSLPYGYEVVREFDSDGSAIRGKRRIVPERAEIIRRIFEAYADGNSPRLITKQLNREAVPGPRGGMWNASSINGNRARRDGILWNEIYVGRLIYNRQRFVKDPETGRRLPKPNPPEEWLIVAAPDLQIVDQTLWDRVHRVKARSSTGRLHMRRRPRRLLSGLIYCGVCNGHYTVIGEERIGCTTHRERGACSNGRTMAVHKLEERVLNGLKDKLLTPELIAEFVREFHLHVVNIERDESRRREASHLLIREVDEKIDRMVTAIEGGAEVAAFHKRLIELEERRRTLSIELGRSNQAIPAFKINPKAADLYRQKVCDLRATLNADSEARQEAASILRSLVDKIVLHPGQRRGDMAIELHGQIASVLALDHQKEDAEVMLMVVAGEGFEPPTKGL